MRIDQLIPGTFFKSDGTSSHYHHSLHITRCWDGGFADAGFRAYPFASVDVISAQCAGEMAREALQFARRE